MIKMKNVNNKIIECAGEKETIVNFLNNNGYKNINTDDPIMVIGYLVRERYSLYLL